MTVSLALVVLVLAARASSAAAAADSQVSTAPPPSAGEEKATAASAEDADCICVPYYLCGYDGYIDTAGVYNLDGRHDGRWRRSSVDDVLTESPCSALDVCCKPRREVQHNTTATNTTKTTQLPLHQPDDCGIQGADVIRNVSDGGRSGSTEFAEFPWTLALLRIPDPAPDQEEKDMFVCGASLVHPEVVMTAAKCVSRAQVSKLKVRAGEWDAQSSNETLPHQERQVTRIALHPGFNEATLYNDVALLFLDSPFQPARNVRTLCLPRQGDVLDGSRCIATGWGKNAFGANGTYQTTMKMVELPVVAHDTCQSKLRNTWLSSYFNLHESFVCAGGEQGKDTCQGDGGGPLFCRSPRDSGRYVQLGITSWGIKCGKADVPAVYANVPSFADWVASQLPQASGPVDGGLPSTTTMRSA